MTAFAAHAGRLDVDRERAKELLEMTDVEELPAALRGPRRHLFLSPHYDDIALSVGGTVSLLTRAGLVVETPVVFGHEPDSAEPLSSFARELHDAWGLAANEVIARRRAEEQSAASLLGARSSVLPFRDAIYRERHYLANDDLFGAPAAAEDQLPEMVAAALSLPAAPDQKTRIYAPLGVGSHVDHQLVFQAGVVLARADWNVWFYEDIPYSLRPNALTARLEQLAAGPSVALAASVPIADVWERKLDAILAYPSQLETVFRQYVGVGTSRAEISEALLAYARKDGEPLPVERFWQLAPAIVGEGS